MSGRLDGRVALVTGAGGGIGVASARRMAADGATVVLADIDAKAAEAAAANIPGSIAMVVDLTEEPSVKALAEAIITRLGRIDVLHNMAAGAGHMFTADRNDAFAKRLLHWLQQFPEEVPA